MGGKRGEQVREHRAGAETWVTHALDVSNIKRGSGGIDSYARWAIEKRVGADAITESSSALPGDGGDSGSGHDDPTHTVIVACG